jgi:phosphate acetyltransferase
MADRGQITAASSTARSRSTTRSSPEAAKIKKIASPVAGRANSPRRPDLEAGNMLAKSLSFLAGADAAGIVLGRQGADHPHQPRGFGHRRASPRARWRR